MLGDASWSRHHSDLVRVLAKAGGEDAGPELAALLRRESAFWKRAGPPLKVGWWNGAGAGRERLREHYGLSLEAIRGLGEVRYGRGREAVAELRDLWRSLPQLVGEVSQLAEECDGVLARLKQGPSESTRSRR
jgi:hypothetical protein